MKLEFSRQIFEKYSNFMKIRPVGAELFHEEGRTDMTKLTPSFRNFAKAPKNAVKKQNYQKVKLYITQEINV
jgi:hypothetical protein